MFYLAHNPSLLAHNPNTIYIWYSLLRGSPLLFVGTLTNSREDLFSHDPSIETRTLIRRPWQAGFTNQYFLRFPGLIASYSSQPGQANSPDQYCIHPKSRNISSFHIFAIEKFAEKCTNLGEKCDKSVSLLICLPELHICCKSTTF